MKDVRAIGASLYRDGVMTGAVLLLPKVDFDALVREVNDMRVFAGATHPKAKADESMLIVRTVCGDIYVTSPDGCEQVTTVFRASP